MKKILLTGATDGIGLATAKLLASQGHYLMLHGRSEEKLKEVLQQIKSDCPQAVIEIYQADLTNFEEIRAMVSAILSKHHQLDVIINNAGVFKTSVATTSNGLDSRFMVNTFAPYLITKALMSLLADDGRVVNLSSAAQAPVSLEAMAGKVHINDDFQVYAQSKLAITMWSQEMANILKAKQVIVAVNPGSLLASKMVKEGFGVTGNDISIGAEILVRAALSVEFANASGKYFDNDAKQFSNPHFDAQNQSKCEQLVAVIEAIISEH